MKEFYFAADLLTLSRHDRHYSEPKRMLAALRKFGLPADERTDNYEQMLHRLVVHIIEQHGETEVFLTETFIYPESLIELFRKRGLPLPAALQPAGTTKSGKDALDPGQFEQCFATVCRNCGTRTDPLGKAYQTPLGRLIFRVYLETRRSLGINTTAKYVLDHLKDFDSDKIVVTVEEDSVVWLTDDSKEKLTSVQTIEKFILKFSREIAALL